MNVIYVGDASKLRRRVIQKHVKGDGGVHTSPLRRHTATAWSIPFKYERHGIHFRAALDVPDAQKADEVTAELTAYVRSGSWRFVECESAEEAKDFQWYCIEQLKPSLNRDEKPWNKSQQSRYKCLLDGMRAERLLSTDQDLATLRERPGVYVFYHEEEPGPWRERRMLRVAEEPEIAPFVAPLEEHSSNANTDLKAIVVAVTMITMVGAAVYLLFAPKHDLLRRLRSWRPASSDSWMDYFAAKG